MKKIFQVISSLFFFSTAHLFADSLTTWNIKNSTTPSPSASVKTTGLTITDITVTNKKLTENLHITGGSNLERNYYLLVINSKTNLDISIKETAQPLTFGNAEKIINPVRKAEPRVDDAAKGNEIYLLKEVDEQITLHCTTSPLQAMINIATRGFKSDKSPIKSGIRQEFFNPATSISSRDPATDTNTEIIINEIDSEQTALTMIGLTGGLSLLLHRRIC